MGVAVEIPQRPRPLGGKLGVSSPLFLRCPWLGGAAGSHSSDLLHNLLFRASLYHAPHIVSWDHLLNKVLAQESSSQGVLLGGS